ncbi:hypothetical protein L218DRAFT_954884 [Marasmius fiardii PR-910]|nr:hypothetical protein L218DRAFT_954884 [Marasmius fiardii PR-910]
MAQIPVLPVCLANVAIESLLYGIFFVLNTSSLVLALQYLPRSLFNDPPGHHDSQPPISTFGRLVIVLKKPMFLGTAPLFLTVTAHWVCTVIRAFEAFVVYNHGTDPTGYYLDISQPIYILKTGVMFGSVIISDGMMVYRLWVVWNYNYRIIILPVLNILAFLASGIGTTHSYAVAPPGTSLINYPTASRWIIADVVLSVCTNVYSTTLIAWRVWQTHRASETYGRLSSPGSTNLMAALAMFVESALIFTIWVLFFASFYGARSALESLAEDNVAVIAGITFSLINVRIVLGRASLQNGALTTVLTDCSAGSPCRCSMTVPGGQGGLGGATVAMEEDSITYPTGMNMRRMAVHVHQIQTSDRGYGHGCVVDIDHSPDKKLSRDDDQDAGGGMFNANFPARSRDVKERVSEEV